MNTCDNKAQYRYTWPGQDESFICEEHSKKLRAVAQAMSFHLQLIPFPENELPEKDFQHIVKCRQEIT